MIKKGKLSAVALIGAVGAALVTAGYIKHREPVQTPAENPEQTPVAKEPPLAKPSEPKTPIKEPSKQTTTPEVKSKVGARAPVNTEPSKVQIKPTITAKAPVEKAPQEVVKAKPTYVVPVSTTLSKQTAN